MDKKSSAWLDQPIHPALPLLTTGTLIFAVIVLVAIVSRFYDLGARVMSHDESLHTYFSWLLYRGQGYQHSPMMHGPFQFHIIALTYFLLGVSDFTARIPAALFSVSIIWLMWYWRRYLGGLGALIAAMLLVISPYMLYYGRYVRNESYAAFAGILMLYSILRHLETGERKYLFLFTGSLALHYVSKETSFIYTAQALLFLAIYFVARVTRSSWTGNERLYKSFIIALGITVLLAGSALGYGLITQNQETITGTETAAPADPSNPISPLSAPATSPLSVTAVLILAGMLTLAAALYLLIRGFTWTRIRAERSFDLLMIGGMIVLPMLTPFPIKWAEHWLKVTIPTTAPEVQALAGDQHSIITIALTLVIMFALSIAAGLIWNKDLWWKAALVFWVPFTILYTTVFTNSDGFFTGTIGSLGYWLVQQGVERGSQPWYYYLLIQIPLYEFLPALGFLLALAIGIRHRHNGIGDSPVDEADNNSPMIPSGDENNFPAVFGLLTWWSITSIIAYSVAGEKMPWLTVHIAWPLIVMTGWGLGKLIEPIGWSTLRERRVWLAMILIVIFIAGLTGALQSGLGSNPPFQGKELAELQATGAFLLPAIVSVACLAGLFTLLKDWSSEHLGRIVILMIFGILAILTARTSLRAAYINYDQATEFLVYAHAGRGVKDVIEQAIEISERTTGGMGIALAYDASEPDTGVSWPFVWYLRDFTNQHSFNQPTRSLRDSVVVIVDQKNFDKIEAALGPGFYRMDYIRMWWPMQDYFGLVTNRDPQLDFPQNYPCRGVLGIFRLFKSRDFTRICDAIVNPQLRAGILQIWFNRDYSLYAQATGRSDLTLATWQPSDQMRLYIRKDIASQIWNYGIGPAEVEQVKDPTEEKIISLSADLILDDNTAPQPIQLNAPRALAFAPDGSLYVTDSRNHRVVHLDIDGRILQSWGSFADGVSKPAGPGTFNEPWGIAIGTDGAVYVTDTWNHRVQKFTSDGNFLKTWGFFGQGETPDAFYGPRGLAVDSHDRVYVADTGNKRIVVFDKNGNYLTQFGSPGLEPGQFDEPVGVAIDDEGRVYVTDTWNQRIQTFLPASDGTAFIPERQSDVYGWFGQSLDNKPFIAVNAQKHVFITDPEGFRVMEFDDIGQLQRVWGDFDNTASGFGLASGIAIDSTGHIWVTDGLYNRLLRFTLPD